jgi:ArsR family transcriptional regulator
MATQKSISASVKSKPKASPVSAKNALSQKASARALKTTSTASKKKAAKPAELDVMFELAAETFRVMSAPMRLKIINCLCTEEKNVGQLLEEIDTTQPNMSQHLNTLFKAKILGRRREGVQIYYRIINERVVTLCRAVCTQIAIDSDIPHD